jgi:hypothetical protein
VSNVPRRIRSSPEPDFRVEPAARPHPDTVVAGGGAAARRHVAEAERPEV